MLDADLVDDHVVRPWLALSLLMFTTSCSDRPLPIPLEGSPRYYDLDTATAACLTRIQCQNGSLGDHQDLGVCVDQLTRLNGSGYQLDAHAVHCLADARGDCARAAQCLFSACTSPDCDGSVCRSLNDTCVGQTLNTCFGLGSATSVLQIDCGSLGLTCSGGEGDHVSCALGGSCSDHSTGGRCQGSAVVACLSGNGANYAYGGVDCSDVGAGCVDTGGTSAAHCEGTGPACAPGQPAALLPGAGTLRCDKDRLVYCVNGREATFDCATLREHCLVDGGVPRCALGVACDVNLFTATCAGGTITYCKAGLVVEEPWSCLP